MLLRSEYSGKSAGVWRKMECKEPSRAGGGTGPARGARAAVCVNLDVGRVDGVGAECVAQARARQALIEVQRAVVARPAEGTVARVSDDT